MVDGGGQRSVVGMADASCGIYRSVSDPEVTTRFMARQTV